MPWTLFVVPHGKKGALDELLKDDQISRQSQKVRDASAVGGPADSYYVLIEGSADAVRHAERLLADVGERPSPEASESIYQRFREEDEAASTGMGLFFTE